LKCEGNQLRRSGRSRGLWIGGIFEWKKGVITGKKGSEEQGGGNKKEFHRNREYLR